MGEQTKPDGKKSENGVSGENGTQDISPETLRKLDEMRGRIVTSFGQITLAMMNLPRYRHQSLSDLTHLVLDPIMQDRLAIATAKPEHVSPKATSDATMGAAVWAKVSDEVQGKIREQIKAGVFPTRLKSEDWNSGEHIWLLDVIAPNQRLATEVLKSFRQVAKEGKINVHPIVNRLVDPGLLNTADKKPEDDPQTTKQ